MNDLLYISALSYNRYIGPKRYLKIRSSYPDIKNYFSLKVSEQMDFVGVKSELARVDFENMLFEAEKILKICSIKGIRQVPEEDPIYPSRLKTLSDRPFMLYIKGDFRGETNLLAVVGTREFSREAAELNSYFTKEFCSMNIGIVSGLARGHDMIAAKTALDCEAYTVAVLGSGIDVIYPQESAELYNRIAVKGALVSEYPPGVSPLTQNFPLRNRIISGISEAVLVIQAPERSGALITAEFASQQGREVYVVPGSPIDRRNRGSNLLIQNGARLAVSPREMAREIFGGKLKEQKINDEHRKLSGLSTDEIDILDRLNKETDFEELLNITGKSVMNLNHILTKLELEGHVIQYPGRYYIRNQSL